MSNRLTKNISTHNLNKLTILPPIPHNKLNETYRLNSYNNKSIEIENKDIKTTTERKKWNLVEPYKILVTKQIDEENVVKLVYSDCKNWDTFTRIRLNEPTTILRIINTPSSYSQLNESKWLCLRDIILNYKMINHLSKRHTNGYTYIQYKWWNARLNLVLVIEKTKNNKVSIKIYDKEWNIYTINDIGTKFEKIITDKQNDWNKYVNQLFCAILCPIKYDKNVHLMWIVDLEKKNNTIYKMLNFLKLQFS